MGIWPHSSKLFTTVFSAIQTTYKNTTTPPMDQSLTKTVNSKVVLHDVPPYLRVYTDGTIERLVGTETVPAGHDPETGVVSKDVVIHPETGVSARIYHPNPHSDSPKKLPLLVYFHGGAFVIATPAEPMYHRIINKLVKQAHIIVVSVDYRLAPENPLPAVYDDSWGAIQWVASHMKGGSESWLKEHVDFNRVFLSGDSAGANISHHMAMRAGLEDHGLGEFKISGLVLVHPYFWGQAAIGAEAENPVFKTVVDKWWTFLSVSDRGCDDPLINPFVEDAPSLDGLASQRILVCVAANDILRERGRLYYQKLVNSKWKGKVEFHETSGEDHVFHIFNPNSENAINLIKICAEFINH